MIVQGPDGKRIEFPDGTPPEQIKAAMAKHYGAPKAAAAPPQAQLDPFQYFNLPVASPISVRADRSVDAFPAMGGMVGGVAFGVPGAAMYGGAMETLRRSLRGLPLEPKAAVREGIHQGALQLGGAALGAGAALASKTVGPAGRLAERALANPAMRRMGRFGRYGLPAAGALRGGIQGALAGMAIPLAGRAALSVALSPRTEALLGSMAFRSLARHAPQAAAAIYQQTVLAEQPDATNQ